MIKNKHEQFGGNTTSNGEGSWDSLRELEPSNLSVAKDKGNTEKVDSESDGLATRREKISRISSKLHEIYREQDLEKRQRVERIKENIDYSSQADYEKKAIEAKPTNAKKVARWLADKFRLKTKRGEEQREREAVWVALEEYRAEQQAHEREVADYQRQRALEQAQAEAKHKAYLERREKETLARQMSQARDLFDYRKHSEIQQQRVQELVERDLNSRLLTVDNLEEEALSENSEVQKRFVEFEGSEIPVYDLEGLPFAMLSTTIDYRNANKPGEIGTETYKEVMANPAIWLERQDEAERADGFGTRNEHARGNAISTSYRNSERNLKSYVPGELTYGFGHVDAGSVFAVVNGDAGSNNVISKSGSLIAGLDAIDRLEGAGGTKYYNEVVLRRYSETGEPKRPDYIVARNGQISEAALRHAKFFNIPIVNIEESVYEDKAEKKGMELIDSIKENDTYPEIDRKMAELSSMSKYKYLVKNLDIIGRARDVPELSNYFPQATPLEERCFRIAQLEQQKRLEFIEGSLEDAVKKMESGEAPTSPRGKVGLGQFDVFDVSIQDVQHQLSRSELTDTEDKFYGVGNCNWVDIRFRLKGSSRIVETRIYDGERVYGAEEAAKYGVYDTPSTPGAKADSSYYDKLEPIVLKYFEAVRDMNAVN